MRVDYTILRIDDHSGRKSMLAEGTAEPVARPAMGKVNHFRGKSRHFPSDRIVIRDFCVLILICSTPTHCTATVII